LASLVTIKHRLLSNERKPSRARQYYDKVAVEESDVAPIIREREENGVESQYALGVLVAFIGLAVLVGGIPADDPLPVIMIIFGFSCYAIPVINR